MRHLSRLWSFAIATIASMACSSWLPLIVQVLSLKSPLAAPPQTSRFGFLNRRTRGFHLCVGVLSFCLNLHRAFLLFQFTCIFVSVYNCFTSRSEHSTLSSFYSGYFLPYILYVISFVFAKHSRSGTVKENEKAAKMGFAL